MSDTEDTKAPVEKKSDADSEEIHVATLDDSKPHAARESQQEEVDELEGASSPTLTKVSTTNEDHSSADIEAGMDVAVKHIDGSRLEEAGTGPTAAATNAFRPRSPRRSIQPGAVAVPGPNADEYDDDAFTTELAFAVPGLEHEEITVTMDGSDVDTQADDLIAAELVDPDKERRLVQEKVQKSLQRERAKAPIAQVVQERFCDRRRSTLVMILALLTILGIVLGVTLSNGRGLPPAPVPSKEEILEVLTISFDDGETLLIPGSPQNRAFNWLANDTFQGYYTDEKLIQRYSLASLFYNTNGNGWTNNSLWLDNGDECDR